jgi:hypothetical protein
MGPGCDEYWLVILPAGLPIHTRTAIRLSCDVRDYPSAAHRQHAVNDEPRSGMTRAGDDAVGAPSAAQRRGDAAMRRSSARD